MRDGLLVHGLLARGHDVEVIPLYTPLRLDDPQLLPASPRLHFSGINVYLAEKSRLFAAMPGFARRVFENRTLLSLLSALFIETRPSRLGALTVSVLAGRDGNQKKDLQRLMRYLEGSPRPDVISLTNSLLSALAPECKSRLGAPIACALQGEDSFLEGMTEPHRSQAHELIRRNVRAIDLFIAPGAAHARKMQGVLGIPAESVCVVRAGVDTESYSPPALRESSPLIIGYLSVITPCKGLDLLAEAFIAVAQENKTVQLHVAGKALDKSYYAGIVRRLDAAGLRQRYVYHGEVTLAQKQAFLRRCSVFVLPTRIEESRAVAVLEALACGAPSVVPAAGVFPEMAERGCGVTLFRREDVSDLTSQVLALVNDEPRRRELGQAAAAGVRLHYSAPRMIEETLAAYERIRT
jgi:glycosyltransferase involved in cell wall biosynthesis